MVRLTRLGAPLGALALALALVGCQGTSTTPTTAVLTLSARPNSMLADGTASTIHIQATDATGAAGTGSVALTTTAGVLSATSVALAAGEGDVTFSCDVTLDSACTSAATISGTWLSTSTTTRVTLRAPGGPGASDGGTDGGVTVSPGVPTAMSWTSTKCNGSNCPVMGTANSGFNTLATVNFTVVDQNGDPFGGATVAYTLNRPPAGTGPASGTVTTGVDGLAHIQVQSGNVFGSFNVHAKVTAPTTSGSIEADSPTIGVSGALPSNAGLQLFCDPVNTGVFVQAQPSEPRDAQIHCTVKVVDRNNNPVGTGTPVNFKSEAGAIASSALTEPYDPVSPAKATVGSAEVSLSTLGPLPIDVSPLPADATQYPFQRAAEPSYHPTGGAAGIVYNPRDGLVTVIAYLRGEESYTDTNKNGRRDTGEPFVDQGEAFVDSNDNNQWDPGELYVDDAPANGQYDGPNGTYDPDTTVWTETKVLFTGRPASDGIASPRVAVTAANACGGAGSIPRGGRALFDAFFPDRFLNTPQLSSDFSLQAKLVPGDKGAVTFPANTLDGYGFTYDRLKVNAADQTKPCVEEASGGSALTPICRFKSVFYDWSAGYVGTAEVSGLAAADPAASCVTTALRLDVTSFGVPSSVTSGPIGLEP